MLHSERRFQAPRHLECSLLRRRVRSAPGAVSPTPRFVGAGMQVGGLSRFSGTAFRDTQVPLRRALRLGSSTLRVVDVGRSRRFDSTALRFLDCWTPQLLDCPSSGPLDSSAPLLLHRAYAFEERLGGARGEGRIVPRRGSWLRSSIRGHRTADSSSGDAAGVHSR
jgi:hypothetical protein